MGKSLLWSSGMAWYVKMANNIKHPVGRGRDTKSLSPRQSIQGECELTIGSHAVLLQHLQQTRSNKVRHRPWPSAVCKKLLDCYSILPRRHFLEKKSGINLSSQASDMNMSCLILTSLLEKTQTIYLQWQNCYRRVFDSEVKSLKGR